MSVEIHGQLPSGSEGTPQLNFDKYFVQQDAFARAVERGRVFATCIQGTGIITQAGLSATDAILALSNPAGSGKTLRLWYFSFLSKIATTAAAVVWLGANTNTVAAVVTGTQAVVRKLKLGGLTDNQGQTALALTTATLPAAPVAISMLGVLLTGAITVSAYLQPLERWYNGGLLIQPGTTVSPQTSTATAAAAGHAEFIWEEVDQL